MKATNEDVEIALEAIDAVDHLINKLDLWGRHSDVYLALETLREAARNGGPDEEVEK
ncbi:hypothetical protein QYI97_10470 [Lacticaseibacillus paracasei]|uniref:hypothetical protein n=1 Tax=Lacticaseibacillus paracasei TaxID=1597 RepID=UPI00262771D5|nr:hypothetical protein [Lacticaseibacillus paracasei]MDN4554647.1 hypothetical protein [Lacticaseibacillus paracasei]